MATNGGSDAGSGLFLDNSKYLSIDECRQISKKGRYVNFSAKILAIASKDLSGTAFKIWQLISAESVFDCDWSVQLSCSHIAVEMQRSTRQVTRLINELVEKGY